MCTAKGEHMQAVAASWFLPQSGQFIRVFLDPYKCIRILLLLDLQRGLDLETENQT